MQEEHLLRAGHTNLKNHNSIDAYDESGRPKVQKVNRKIAT